jgi:hypothetical protein
MSTNQDSHITRRQALVLIVTGVAGLASTRLLATSLGKTQLALDYAGPEPKSAESLSNNHFTLYL